MRGKRAEVLGEGVITLYRILLVTIIALVIFGVYTIFYTYHIDIRDSEARILGRGIIDCLAPRGIANLENMNSQISLLNLCKYSGSYERYYVKATLYDAQDTAIVTKTHGDSGLIWIRDLLASSKVDSSIQTYKPGYYTETYPVLFNKDETLQEGKMELEVLVNAEE